MLTANAPETKDNDFTWEDFQARNNNELVAILGNFVNRAVVLTRKYFGGMVPASRRTHRHRPRHDGEYVRRAAVLTRHSTSNSTSARALREAMEMARIGNRYLQETEPWKTAKTDRAAQ